MTADHTPTQVKFESASRWLSSAPAAAGLPTEVKLELYGLFKYISTSEGPTGGRPSIFSPTPRAKYDAWAAQHQKFAKLSASDPTEEARKRYIEIAATVGWDGHIDMSDDEEEIDLENLDAEDSESQSRNKARVEDRQRSDNAMGGVKVSVMAGADATADNELGSSASKIHDAVLSNSSIEVRNLINREPNLINLKDEFGYTPLHLAADRGYDDVVEMLLSLGADKSVQDEDGQTALELAQISGRSDIVSILKE